MSTPSPYLRDRLLQAADGLRKDAETARLNVAAADQDVAAARALLAEAEAHAARARAEVDGIEAGIAWAQAHAHAISREIDADPAAKLRATGLMRHEPKPVDPAPGSATLYQDNGLPMVWDSSVPPGGYVCAVPAGEWDGICGRPVESESCDQHDHYYIAGIGDPRCLCGNLWPCDGDAAPDDLLFNVVQAPQDVVAALTGSHPAVPDGHAGVVVATHGPTTTAPIGPTVTTPDAGLAHPVPNPPVLPPADPTGTARHAKPADRPGLLARLTGGHRIVHDEQDGDDQ